MDDAPDEPPADPERVDDPSEEEPNETTLEVVRSSSWAVLYGESAAVLPVTPNLVEIAFLASSPRIHRQRLASTSDALVSAGFDVGGAVLETGRVRLEMRAAADLAFGVLRTLAGDNLLPRSELAHRVARLIQNAKLYDIEPSDEDDDGEMEFVSFEHDPAAS